MLGQDTENEVAEMLDTVAAANDTSAEAEDALFLEGSLAMLTPQQRRVIVAVVLEGVTELELASELGISQPAVHQMKSLFFPVSPAGLLSSMSLHPLPKE